MKKIIVCLAYVTLILHNIAWGCAHQPHAKDEQEQIITLKAGKQLGKLPQSIAYISSFIRNYSTTNKLPISLDCTERPFDLKTLLSLLKEAKKILQPNPVTCKESYIQLTQQEPLASLNDAKKLLGLFNICDFLQVDFHQTQQHNLINAASIALVDKDIPTLLKIQHSLQQHDKSLLKAIALKLAQLIISKDLSLETIDEAAQELNYNFESCAYPLVTAQYFLTHKNKETLSEDFIITVRDLLIHEKIRSCVKNNGFTLDLFNYHIRYLDGIMDVSNIQNITTINLSKNQLIHLQGNFSFPQLTSLDLSKNRLTYLPDNFDAPKLAFLHLDDNQFDQWPLDTAHIKVPLLKSLWIQNNSLVTLPSSFPPALQNVFIGGNPVAENFAPVRSERVRLYVSVTR